MRAYACLPQVVQRQHRVGLGVAEIGLKLHHRVAAITRDALHAAHEQALQALGEVGAAEELLRPLVLVRAPPWVHLPDVGGELSLLVAPARHIGVEWPNYLAVAFSKLANAICFATARDPSLEK